MGNSKRLKAENGDDFDGQNGENEETFDEELPMVSAGGKMVPLLDVTEEIQAQMTPDEYEAYYNICQQYQ